MKKCYEVIAVYRCVLVRSAPISNFRLCAVIAMSVDTIRSGRQRDIPTKDLSPVQKYPGHALIPAATAAGVMLSPSANAADDARWQSPLIRADGIWN